jgi:uncharacterized protein (TIGR02594 family)
MRAFDIARLLQALFAMLRAAFARSTAKPSPALRCTGITATQFGGQGDANASAYGGTVDPNKPGVALPFRFAGARPQVRVWSGTRSVVCDIVDVGPWYPSARGGADPYWQGGARPRAESDTRTNGAGIDLTPAAWAAIGAAGRGKGKVDWEFIDAADAAAPWPARKGARPAPTRAAAAEGGAAAWLAFSEKEIGIKETPGPNATPRIVQYRAIAGCDLKGDDGDVPWCRIYLCAILRLAGLPYRKDWMARAVERDPNFVKLDGPALGAICSFWRGSRTSGLGHTGFYRGECKGRILVEGGNESDAVRRAFFPRSGALMGLVGYYWPKSMALPPIAPIRVTDDGHPTPSAT